MLRRRQADHAFAEAHQVEPTIFGVSNLHKLLLSHRFTDWARSTASRVNRVIWSNCLPPISSFVTIQLPPHATTLPKARYFSRFSGVIPPVGMNRIIPYGAAM